MGAQPIGTAPQKGPEGPGTCRGSTGGAPWNAGVTRQPKQLLHRIPEFISGLRICKDIRMALQLNFIQVGSVLMLAGVGTSDLKAVEWC